MTKDPFRIRDHVGDFDEVVADIRRRSEAARSTIPMASQIAYGADTTETLDLFFPQGERRGLPVHIFIHGGYWRMFSSRDYSYVAETVTRAGAIAVIVDYALMPAVRMATIVDQVRGATRWVVDHIADHGGDAARLTVSGHSAGAHLATFLFNDPGAPKDIRAALLLGGIYDLKPLQSSFLAGEIGITDQEVAEFSPITQRFQTAVKTMILVGESETPPFHHQADDFGDQLRRQGVDVSNFVLAGSNHMSSVRNLGVANTPESGLLERLIQT